MSKFSKSRTFFLTLFTPRLRASVVESFLDHFRHFEEVSIRVRSVFERSVMCQRRAQRVLTPGVGKLPAAGLAFFGNSLRHRRGARPLPLAPPLGAIHGRVHVSLPAPALPLL